MKRLCAFFLMFSLCLLQAFAESDNQFCLVTNASQLHVGDEVVIVSRNHCIAISKYEASPYIKSCHVDVLQNGAAVEVNNDSVAVFVMEKSGSSWSFKNEDKGWSFGILTAGQSKNAQDMVNKILSFSRNDTEIIICGDMPCGIVPGDRIKHIDLPVIEPRGWITKKKLRQKQLVCQVTSYQLFMSGSKKMKIKFPGPVALRAGGGWFPDSGGSPTAIPR